MLSFYCCDATRPLIQFPVCTMDFHQLASLWETMWLLWAFHYFYTYNYWREIKSYIRYKRCYLAQQHSEEKPAEGPRCCRFHQTTPESSWSLKKKTLLQSFSNGEQTVRERSDIDLLRPRIMFKSIRLQGVDWSGFIKCKHFQVRHSLKWEKSRELGMRKRQKANEKRKREQFLCFLKKKKIPGAISFTLQPAQDRWACLLDDGAFQPQWWLQSLCLALTWNYGQQPQAHTARALCGQGCSTHHCCSSGSSNDTHINGLYGLLISVWTNRHLHLLMFDVFQGHGSVYLAEWASTCRNELLGR